MRYVIAGEKLKEGVEAMRRQLAFMIRFINSPVWLLMSTCFLTCGGRTCNQNVATMFLCVVQRTPLLVIMPNFVESGHSHMESDPMQSAIEREKRHADAFTMLDWVQISRQARRKNPYKVFIITTKTSITSKNLHRGFLQTSAALLMVTWSSGFRLKTSSTVHENCTWSNILQVCLSQRI